MKSLWSYFEDYFTPEECDIITLKCLNAGLTKGFQDGGIGHDGELNKDFRSCRVVGMQYEEFPEIFQKIIQAVEGANQTWFGNIDIDTLRGIDFTEYDEKYTGKYNEHIDVMWCNDNSNLETDPKHRKLSFTLQLSDPSKYEGCNLILNPNDVIESGNPDANKIRKQGCLTVFPSWLRHKVTPITRGTRYALVGWVEGPTWR